MELLTMRSGGYNDDETSSCTNWSRENYGTWGQIGSFSGQQSVINHGSFSGMNIPHFHSRRRKGELMMMTPFTQDHIYGTCSGSYHVSCSAWPYQQGEIRPDGAARFLPDWIIDDNALAQHCPDDPIGLCQESAAKIMSESFDALTFLAELTDVRDMFLSAGSKLLRLKFPKNWKSLSSDWLAYRYGWRPLISDLKTLSEMISNSKDRLVRHSKRSSDVSSHTSTSTRMNPVGSYFSWQVTVIDEVTTRLRGSVTADIVLPKLQFNPLVTGWELIPFSFVIDWFVSIGKALLAYSFLSRHPSYVAASGYEVTFKRTMQVIETGWMPTWSGSCPQEGTCTAVRQVRTPCNIPLFPQIRLRLDVKKVLDLLAMMVQRR